MRAAHAQSSSIMVLVRPMRPNWRMRNELIAAGVGRETKRTSKKVDTAALSAAMRDGQGARLRARSVLGGAKRTLLALGNIAGPLKIEALLERDRCGRGCQRLAKQLDALQDVLKDPAIADAAKDRGWAQSRDGPCSGRAGIA
ncbi:MAG: hypothetical protein IPM54_40985 [Polyangiaceae bacterium]|nr:hypothetical protein [Polyangiaceae bacterium]